MRAFLRRRLGISVQRVARSRSRRTAGRARRARRVGGGAAAARGGARRCRTRRLRAGGARPRLAASRDARRRRCCDRVRTVVVAARRRGRVSSADGAPRSLDVNLRLPDGRLLAGTVPGVCGCTIRRISYSRVRPRDRLAAWVRLLALTAARPERPWHRRSIGALGRGLARRAGGRRPDPARSARTTPLRREAALRQLGALVDLYDRGMREPLPLACEASAAYARGARSRSRRRSAAAQSAWETTFGYDKEDRAARAHARPRRRAELRRAARGQRPRDDEQGAGWAQSEPTRFGRYARRLWDGLLALRGRDRPVTRLRDRRAVRRLRPAAVRGDGARGQRRDRQDVHDRRAGRPLRRRGDPARAAAAGDVHAAGDRRAARPRPRAARRLRAAALPRSSPAPRTSGADEVVDAARDRQSSGRRAAGASGSPAPWPTSTRRRSPPPTASATRCWRSSGPSATSSPGRCSSRTSRTCSRRCSTTSTCVASTAAATPASTAREALSIARAAAFNPGDALEPHDAPRDSTAAMRYRLACAVRAELERRKRRMAIMTYDDLLTRLNETLEGAQRRRPRRSGCARATASCWSTSSRTPTRCSGRSCTARSRPRG